MYQRYLLSMAISALALVPFVSQAASISLNDISPAVDENITPPDNQKASEENFYTFWLKGQIGTEYTVSFDVSEEPAFTFVSGGDMSLDNNISYDDSTGTFTVTYTAVELEQIDSQSELSLEENQTLTIVAISFPVAEGEAGPGESTIGSWLATNFQEWILTTPSSEHNMIGATVSGDAGDTGDFELFMPATTMDAMAELDNADSYSAEDFALYQDGDKADADIEAVSGGAYLNFSTTIPEESSEDNNTDQPQAVTPTNNGVDQSLMVAPLEAITLNSSKNSVEKYKYVTLSGKIKSGRKGEKVSLWRRFENTTLKKFETVRTKKNGRFELRVKINKNVLFKAKYDGDVSDPIYIQVK